jgi:hypothetical protein
MQHDPLTWPERVRDVLVRAAADVVAERAALTTVPPSEADPFLQLALTPINQEATSLHVFIEETGTGTDSFETGSREASFDLWETPDRRLARLTEIVRAVIEGRCMERIAYVGETAVKVEMTFLLAVDGETTYSLKRAPANHRFFEMFRGPERIETRTFEAY